MYKGRKKVWYCHENAGLGHGSLTQKHEVILDPFGFFFAFGT